MLCETKDNFLTIVVTVSLTNINIVTVANKGGRMEERKEGRREGRREGGKEGRKEGRKE